MPGLQVPWDAKMVDIPKQSEGSSQTTLVFVCPQDEEEGDRAKWKALAKITPTFSSSVATASLLWLSCPTLVANQSCEITLWNSMMSWVNVSIPSPSRCVTNSVICYQSEL